MQTLRGRRNPAASAIALLAVCACAPVRAFAGPEARHVLILRGELPDAAGTRILIDQIQSSVRKASPAPVEFYQEAVDGRFVGDAYERRLADLLTEKFGRQRVDLVLALGGSSVRFAERARPALFPSAPLLLGLLEPRSPEAAAIPPGASVVFAQIDPVATLRLALQTRPSARRVLVVGGSSRSDREWERLVGEDLRGFPGVTIEYDVDSSIDDLRKRVASVGADTVVLFTSMTRDALNVPARTLDVLETLRSAAAAPIYGLSSAYLGSGIVGGVLLDFDRHGADLGREAARLLLGGEPQRSTTPVVGAVDARELRRFGISASRLPPSVAVRFGQPGIWESNRGTLAGIVLALAIESALIFGLVRLARRRREAQRLIEARLRFERLLSNLSVSLVTASPKQIEAALDTALTLIALEVGADDVWRWEPDIDENGIWYAPLLRAGQPVMLPSLEDLPPSIRARAAHADCQSCAALAVPLTAGGAELGAIFWISRTSGEPWKAHVDELQVVAAIVATVLQRKRAELELERGDRLKGAILDSLPAHVAVLDRDGAIIAVNDAWTDFGRPTSPATACAVALVPDRRGALAMVEAACRGERSSRQIQYACGGTDGVRWFLMTVEPLRRPEGGAVVTHADITASKLNEIALRESEDRFRVMADSLPIAIWMTEVSGECVYVNRQWLELTGRTTEEELGNGWLESLHPSDREIAMDAFLRSFHERRNFASEFRVRGNDGKHRWIVSTGVPRYDSAGAFRGYIGGCIDITEQKAAHRIHRDLNRRLMAAQDDERRRIARELHDHLSQQLALLAINLQDNLRGRTDANKTVASALEDAWRRTAEIASDVHAISHRLHPSKLEAIGLVGTIQAHCRDLSRQTIAVSFQHHDVPERIPPDTALNLFRVLEESLSNAARHSGASAASVTLVGAGSDLLLRIVDEGRGFTVVPGASTGIGLVSMRERLEALNGKLSITSSPGHGTIVEAAVPLPASARTLHVVPPAPPAAPAAPAAPSRPRRVTARTIQH